MHSDELPAIYELNVLVLVGWNDVVLKQIDQIQPVLLYLIDSGRRGNRADWDVVAGVIQSYVQVGQVRSILACVAALQLFAIPRRRQLTAGASALLQINTNSELSIYASEWTIQPRSPNMLLGAKG